jgi:hypothetical protein
MGGFTEQDLGARGQATKPLPARAIGSARGLRVDCARSAGAAAPRRSGDRITQASLRPGLTHRCEDPPAASRHGAPYRVRRRGDRLPPIASGNGFRYHESWRGGPRPWYGFAQRLLRTNGARWPISLARTEFQPPFNNPGSPPTSRSCRGQCEVCSASADGVGWLRSRNACIPHDEAGSR